ncbi:hypothetical protein ACIGT4_30860 [Streptomyces sioyaensis]
MGAKAIKAPVRPFVQRQREVVRVKFLAGFQDRAHRLIEQSM